MKNICKTFAVFFAGLSMVGIFAIASPVGAEDVFEDVCTKAPTSTVCQSRTPAGKNPLFGPDGVLTSAISIMSIVVGIAAVIVIIVGGLKLVTSGSNPQDVAKARETIIYAIVGLVIALLAQVIVQFFLKEINYT